MKRFLTFALCAAALTVSNAASAATISLGLGAGGVAGDHILGEVFQPGDLAGGLVVRDTAAVNGLLAVALGTRSGTSPEYYRSTTNFGSLPAATGTGALFIGSFDNSGFGGTSQVQIVLPSAFQYLIVTYDGPNAGAEVYYIGDIAAGNTLEFFRFAQPSDDGTPNWGHLLNNGTQYGITTWTLLNPTTGVPDGGTTAALLGLGMFGLGLLRRRFKA